MRGLLGECLVTRDMGRDPPHAVVVLRDDVAEGDLVTGSRRCEQARSLSVGHPCHCLHTLYSHLGGLLSQGSGNYLR